MPAPVSIETTARTRMQTILTGIFGDPQRIILGLDDIGFFEYNGNLFDNLISCGPIIYILGAEVDNLDAINRLYTFSIKVKVHYSLRPDTKENYKGINDIMKEIFEALISKSAYTDCLPPTSRGYNKVSDVAHKGAVAGPVGCYEITMNFLAGADCL